MEIEKNENEIENNKEKIDIENEGGLNKFIKD